MLTLAGASLASRRLPASGQWDHRNPGMLLIVCPILDIAIHRYAVP